jgi:hypothetical protein
LVIFCGTIVPSLNIVDVKVNGSAAVAAEQSVASRIPLAATAKPAFRFFIMMFAPNGITPLGQV